MLSFRISSWDLINFLTLRIPLKEGIAGERRPKDRVTLRITLIITYLFSTYFLVMVVLLTHIHVIWICTKPAIHVICLGFKVFARNHLCMNCRQWNMSLDFNMGLLGFIHLCCACWFPFCKWPLLLNPKPYFVPISFQMPYSCLHA
jgi:hypothetical protein